MATHNIVVIVGSLRKDSFSRKVAKTLVELAPSSLNLNIVEIGQLPLYNQDEDENPLQTWTAFRRRVSRRHTSAAWQNSLTQAAS